jgi:hypothetical protein
MKDPALAIRTAYYTIIKATLPTIAVYDSIVANDAPAKRILLSTQTYTEEGTKDGFGGTATIDVDIISRAPLGTGGGKWSDETATAIMEAVTPEKGVCALSVTGWNVVTVTAQIIPFAALEQPTSGDWIHRKIVRFTHQIFQN